MRKLSLILALVVAVAFAASGIAMATEKTYDLTINATIVSFVAVTSVGGPLTFGTSAVAHDATGWKYAGASGPTSSDPHVYFETNDPSIMVAQDDGSGGHDCDLKDGSNRLYTGYRFVYGVGNSPGSFSCWASPGSCFWDMGSVPTRTAVDAASLGAFKKGPTGGAGGPDTGGWWGPGHGSHDRLFYQVKGPNAEPFQQGSKGDIYPQVAIWRNGNMDTPGSYTATIRFVFTY